MLFVIGVLPPDSSREPSETPHAASPALLSVGQVLSRILTSFLLSSISFH